MGELVEKPTVLVLPKKTVETKKDNNHETYFCRLRHPRTQGAADYLCSPGSLLEISYFQPKFGCWFIDKSILADGCLSVATRVDPLFLLLPYLAAASKAGGDKFMILDQILIDEDFNSVQKYLPSMFLSSSCREQLRNVADVKTIEDSESPLARYNEAKTLLWLEKKARRFGQELQRRNFNVCGSRSSSLVISDDRTTFEVNDTRELNNDLLRYGAEVVGDYLTFNMKNAFMKHLGLNNDAAQPEVPPAAKRPKRNQQEPTEDYTKTSTFSPAVPLKKSTKAAKDLAKAAKGTASVMSFFKKK